MTTNSSLSAPDNLLTLLSQTRRLVTYFSASVCHTESEWRRKLIYPASVENDAGHNSLRWRPASLGLTNGFSLECWIKGNKPGSRVNYRWRFARMPTPVFLFLLTLRRLFLMLICYCCIFHPQLLTWNETGPDKHTLALTSLTQEADRSSSTDKFSPLCHGVDANLWTVLPIRFVTFQQKTPTPPPSDEQQMWTGTVFLMSSHVHPKTMQLSSPLSVPHYHNCICGSSHCNNLAHVQERLTCCRFRLRRLCRGWSFGSTLAVSRCLPEVLITP